MNYHNITTADIMNGDGLRVVLWLSGCSHHCNKCQNPQTWDINSGILFDESAKEELFRELNKEYIQGITFSGGDPLNENNLDEVLELVNKIRLLLPEKDIWLYTGYTFEEIYKFELNNKRQSILELCDVLVDGRYIDKLRDVKLKWRGSSNQRVIDLKQTLQKGEIVLWAT